MSPLLKDDPYLAVRAAEARDEIAKLLDHNPRPLSLAEIERHLPLKFRVRGISVLLCLRHDESQRFVSYGNDTWGLSQWRDEHDSARPAGVQPSPISTAPDSADPGRINRLVQLFHLFGQPLTFKDIEPYYARTYPRFEPLNSEAIAALVGRNPNVFERFDESKYWLKWRTCRSPRKTSRVERGHTDLQAAGDILEAV